MDRILIPLEECGERPLEEAGGKARNLGILIRNGFDVPPGFCISAALFRDLLPGTKVAETAGRLDLETAIGMEECEREFSRLIECLEWPPEFAGRLQEAFSNLSGEHYAVAVRSSASAEDLPHLSFAGQYDSFLGIRDFSALETAVKRCWASLFSKRALAYRRKQGIAHHEAFMAVVVQRQVEAEISGVLFTVDPMGMKQTMRINAVEGTGESLVSGREACDDYRVGRNGEILEINRISVEPLMDGIRVKALAELGVRAESIFGSPQDIEWALAGGRFQLLQSRSVTTAGPGAGGLSVPVEWGSEANRRFLDSGIVWWSNFNTRETMPYPFPPLCWTHFRDIIVPAIMKVLFGIGKGQAVEPCSYVVDRVYGRLYWNFNVLAAHPLLGPLLDRGMKAIDAEAGEMFSRLKQDGAFPLHRSPLSFLQCWGARFRALAAVIRYPWFIGIIRIEKRCRRAWEICVDWENRDLSGESLEFLLDRVRLISEEMARLAFPMIMVANHALIGDAVIRFLMRKKSGFQADYLVRAIPGNKTTRCALEMFRLSQGLDKEVRRIIRDTPDQEVLDRLSSLPGAAEFLKRYREFMFEFGHRGPREMDLSTPRWVEDPGFVFQMLRHYLDLGPKDINPEDHFQRMAQERKQKTLEAEQWLRRTRFSRWIPWRILLFRLALKRLQTYLPLRENEKHFGLKGYLALRRIFLHIGERFYRSGWIESPDDVFFLDLDELSRYGTEGGAVHFLVETVRDRRMECFRFNEMAPPAFVRSDGFAADSPGISVSGETLTGTAVSPGCVTGIARIIREPGEGASLKPGEILIAPYTDPGWTPLFLTAGALVMEVGGTLCHGAIVAREYGLPAVVGVRGATDRIRNGDLVIIDGDRGTVDIIKRTGQAD